MISPQTLSLLFSSNLVAGLVNINVLLTITPNLIMPFN